MVMESIIVCVEGQNIKCGIFCDFLFYVLDVNNCCIKVDFSVVLVECDGVFENWCIEIIDGGICIYIGSVDCFLLIGEYIFQIIYIIVWQICYFSDYDELIWNVIGNGW